MGFFDNLVQKAGNEFMAKVSENLDDGIRFIDTGSYALNALLSGSIYGGMPNNKAFALAGEESTGKSFFALSIASYFQQLNPTGAVICFETEGALDDTVSTKEMLKARGIDVDRFYLLPATTVEDFRTQCLKVLNEYLATPKKDRKPMLMILDSLGMLSTNKEMADIAEGKGTRDMTRSQIIRGAFRVLTLKMNRARVPMIITNHTYEVVGAYHPTKEMSGGGGLKFAASIIGFLSKSKAKEGDADDGQLIGAKITVKIDKSRFTREEKKLSIILNHSKGLDRYYGLLEIAELGGVIKKISTKYEFPNGTTAFKKHINKDPEKYFTKEVLDLIDVTAGKIFKYGQDDILPEDEAEVNVNENIEQA
jgi:RecA/RadA recombinase